MPIQVSIVTPEMTTFDETADGVVVPLIDGEKGILPGHAPMIGRLGPGELRIKASSGEQRFYVDGGFVQVAPDSVSVLTGKSIPVAEIDVPQPVRPSRKQKPTSHKTPIIASYAKRQSTKQTLRSASRKKRKFFSDAMLVSGKALEVSFWVAC